MLLTKLGYLEVSETLVYKGLEWLSEEMEQVTIFQFPF
ncbi:MAG: hypothetical protein MRERC_4c125 [Mycoplasmataceae bacterium RC_NB112A]|nr:MAG: hypothetical protein MRERC_6c057 [Mycoplasmataceae bacterium RC_NB112A]KLL02159.1 MAG: hypothetical protein MRERC_4c125 [Mycoplasmataceae bacterium RC_NB112A]